MKKKVLQSCHLRRGVWVGGSQQGVALAIEMKNKPDFKKVSFGPFES